MSQTQHHHIQPDPLAFTTHLTPPTQAVVNEYLVSPFTFGEVLENKPQELCQYVLAELSHYVDIRYPGGQVELYFKKEQNS